MSISSGINKILIDNDYYENILQGLIPGHKMVTIFGRNPDIDIGSVPEDVWNGGGTYTGQPIQSAAETIQITSSSVDDAAGGLGARTLRVFGLDENFDLAQEDFTMNGLVPVVSVTLWKRVYLAEVLTAGATAINIGDITIRHSITAANVFATLPAGQGKTTLAVFTVPRNKTYFIKRLKNQIGRANGSAGSIQYSLRIRPEGGVYNAERFETITTNFSDSYTLVGAILVQEKSDIKVTVETCSDNNTQISAVFEGILIDN